jgi:hypothetical protein
MKPYIEQLQLTALSGAAATSHPQREPRSRKVFIDFG